jgi:hypothetical protein
MWTPPPNQTAANKVQSGEMKTSKGGDLAIAIAVDDDALSRLTSIFQKHSKTIEFSVDLSDGSTLYPDTLDQIFEIPNTPNRAITSLAIENHYSEPLRIQVTLSANDFFHAVKFSLKGDDQTVLSVDRDFQEWVLSTKQSYSWLTFVSLKSGILYAFIFLTSFAVISAGEHWKGSPLFLVATVGLALFLVIFSLSGPAWIHKVFPRAAFLIGDGIRRDQTLRDRRKLFSILGIVIAIAIGLATIAIGKLFGL